MKIRIQTNRGQIYKKAWKETDFQSWLPLRQIFLAKEPRRNFGTAGPKLSISLNNLLTTCNKLDGNIRLLTRFPNNSDTDRHKVDNTSL